MADKKGAGDREPVNLKATVVNKVRSYKKRTGTAISTFFEIAAEEKLTRIEMRDSEKIQPKK